MLGEYAENPIELSKVEYEILKSYSLDGMGDFKLKEVTQIGILIEFGYFENANTNLTIDEVLGNAIISRVE